jgi:hypothetical protein
MSPLTTRLWCTGLLRLNILTIPTAIRATCQGQLWHGARGLRWVPPLGALGAATGAIATGTAATSTSTTTIILTGTTTKTSTGAKLAKATDGNITRNIGEMRPTETGKQQISLAVRGLADRVAGSRVLVLERAPAAAKLEQGPAAVALERDPVVAELAPVQVVAVPERDPAAAKLEQGPAAVALERDPVVAELAPVRVVVVPERDPVAVPLRSKSVIAPHRRGLVPVLKRVEDLAVAAETTREPAVTEAAAAWAGAVTVVAAVMPE